MKRYLIINPLVAVGMLTAGYLIGKKFNKKEAPYVGTLNAVKYDEDKDEYIYLALDIPVKEVVRNKYINLRVKHGKLPDEINFK